jgi:hypothetical protein
MRTLILTLAAGVLLASTLTPTFARGRRTTSRYPTFSAPTRVHSYTRRSGRTVMPYYRAPGDRTQFNNWSSSGNINPMTGRRGHRRPKY